MVMIKSRNVAPVQPAKPSNNKYQELRDKLRIDKNLLEDAALRQADLFLEVGEQYTLAVSLRDRARDELSRLDASLARDIYAKGEKVTKAQVDDSIMLDTNHQRLAAEFAVQKKSSDEWGVLKEAYEQRMRMIRELVALYSTGYWTNAGAARNNNEARAALAEDARRKLQDDREQRQRRGGM